MAEWVNIRRATAIHESGHAVVGYLLGLPLIHAALLDASQGEVVPECSLCQTCVEYYQSHDPAEDDHSRTIQDNLRRDAAVAVAGELAEACILGRDHAVDPEELAVDREKAWNLSSAIHLWTSSSCYAQRPSRGDSCSDCRNYLDALRSAVCLIIEAQAVRSAISVLATRLDEASRLTSGEITTILREQGLQRGSIGTSSLPESPSPNGTR